MSEAAPRLGRVGKLWTRLGTRYLPFADAASTDLPLGRLIRLSLFQISVGMAMALTVGTLNRVMIVELNVSSALVAVMVALPLVFAPFRALIGFKSDNHRSVLGWRRVPYMWFGTLLQFGGFAMMPFALLVLSGDSGAPVDLGKFAAAIAFLLVGAGIQTTQTAGLALATDIAPEESRPRVVALMYTMLLVGMVVSGAIFGFLLSDFSPMRLIQVVQGAALLTMILNVTALWKQEVRNPALTTNAKGKDADFWREWLALAEIPGTRRFLVAVALGTAAFSMQDVLLEPYGGEILGLAVSRTTILTAIMACGGLVAFALSARALTRGINPMRLAAYGVLTGLPGFSCVLLAAPLDATWLFFGGATMIGFGSGMFAVGTLTAAMGLDPEKRSGLSLGAWGAVSATAGGLAIAAGGLIRDAVSALAASGALGSALADPATGYGAVYYLEIILLFGALIAIGPLVRYAPEDESSRSTKFGLAQMPV